MTTTSSNIASIMLPFGGPMRKNGTWPYGKVFKIDEIKPREKKKRSVPARAGMMYITSGGAVSESYTTLVDKKKGIWKIDKIGKSGYWRTVNGRRHFFPLDGSDPVPPMRSSKQ